VKGENLLSVFGKSLKYYWKNYYEIFVSLLVVFNELANLNIIHAKMYFHVFQKQKPEHNRNKNWNIRKSLVIYCALSICLQVFKILFQVPNKSKNILSREIKIKVENTNFLHSGTGTFGTTGTFKKT